MRRKGPSLSFDHAVHGPGDVIRGSRLGTDLVGHDTVSGSPAGIRSLNRVARKRASNSFPSSGSSLAKAMRFEANRPMSLGDVTFSLSGRTLAPDSLEKTRSRYRPMVLSSMLAAMLSLSTTVSSTSLLNVNSVPGGVACRTPVRLGLHISFELC